MKLTGTMLIIIFRIVMLASIIIPLYIRKFFKHCSKEIYGAAASFIINAIQKKALFTLPGSNFVDGVHWYSRGQFSEILVLITVGFMRNVTVPRMNLLTIYLLFPVLRQFIFSLLVCFQLGWRFNWNCLIMLDFKFKSFL